MATSKGKTKTKTETAVVVSMQDIVNAGPNGMMVPLATANDLAEKGLVEINTAMQNANGEIATRATQQGIDSLTAGQHIDPQTPKETPVSEVQTAPVAAKAGFAIATVAMPSAGVGRGNRGTKYPFDALELNQSFFCPGVESKTIASTVSSANDRFSEVIEGQTRVNRKGKTVAETKPVRSFVVRSVADGAPWGHPGVKGSAVFRTL